LYVVVYATHVLRLVAVLQFPTPGCPRYTRATRVPRFTLRFLLHISTSLTFTLHTRRCRVCGYNGLATRTAYYGWFLLDVPAQRWLRMPVLHAHCNIPRAAPLPQVLPDTASNSVTSALRLYLAFTVYTRVRAQLPRATCDTGSAGCLLGSRRHTPGFTVAATRLPVAVYHRLRMHFHALLHAAPPRLPCIRGCTHSIAALRFHLPFTHYVLPRFCRALRSRVVRRTLCHTGYTPRVCTVGFTCGSRRAAYNTAGFLVAVRGSAVAFT